MEDYVSFETAKLLKEKGFDDKCRYVYLDTGMRVASQIFMEGESSVNNDDIESVAKYNDWIAYTQGDYAFLCPTIHTVMKWLREVHNIHITMAIENNGNYIGYLYHTTGANIQGWDRRLSKTSYEEAAEAAIKYCLENLI